MFWFEGSIRNAVDKVKSSGVFLLVFVQGEDSLSKKYEAYLNEEAKFMKDDYVAIKIPHDSTALQQFKQIYVSVPIPSVFLIQNNGIPLNVVSSRETSDIHNAIDTAIKKQKTKQEMKNRKQKGLVCEAEEKSSNAASPNPLQYVKNVGRRLTDVSEAEVKKRLKEIRTFPRFWLMDPAHANNLLSKLNAPPSRQSARIQFRLPNNTMPSWEFPDLSTLGDVRAYLMEKTKLSPNFKLLRTYPRSSFSPQDESKTLAELSLTPSATLIVVPVEDKTVQARVRNLIVRQSFLSTLLNSVLWPLLTFFDYFKKRVFNIQSSDRDMEKRPRRLPSDTAFEKTFNKKTSTSNIHGFKFEEDTDTDTEHPDNGNSTQQRFQK